MLQAPLPKNLNRLLNFTLVLMIISAVTVLVFGHSLVKINEEVKAYNKFLSASEQVQPNFEKSLAAYTESTKDAISYLLKLRPEKEKDFIEFIATVEALAQDLGLHLDFEADKKDEKQKNTLNYSVNFYGTLTNLQEFLRQLEALPYYIRVDKIEYLSTAHPDASERGISSNIKLHLQLYIK